MLVRTNPGYTTNYDSELTALKLKAPFPYFGGKSAVAELVWARLGNPRTYIEPFFGSGAILLSRPHAPQIEIINDAFCFLTNFWRALKYDPSALAKLVDWPVSEVDLFSRHQWLVDREAELIKQLHANPDYYDLKIAAWWVWGQCCWTGSGWCGPYGKKSGKNNIVQVRRPHLNGEQGLQSRGFRLTDESYRVVRKRPALGKGGRGVNRTEQGNPEQNHLDNLIEYFNQLSNRLRYVRICCGDWKRVLTPAVCLSNGGITAVFLDPPYAHAALRSPNLYAVDSPDISAEVREWATRHGNDKRFRIALCGLEGEHDMPADWRCIAWKAHGGYSNRGNKQGKKNRDRERIWFSPHCLEPELPLFAGIK